MIDRRVKSGVFAGFIEVWQQNSVYAVGLAHLPAICVCFIEYEMLPLKVHPEPS